MAVENQLVPPIIPSLRNAAFPKSCAALERHRPRLFKGLGAGCGPAVRLSRRVVARGKQVGARQAKVSAISLGLNVSSRTAVAAAPPQRVIEMAPTAAPAVQMASEVALRSN